MQDHPLVTIICLCYNHNDYVLESLLSVKNQSYNNIELIIVDDCSSDASQLIIKKWILNYPEIQFIANKKNVGSTKSFNSALKIAKGDYIIDLAADDILLPNCVSDQVNAFKKSTYKNLGIVYGNVELIAKNGNHESYYFAVNADKKVIQKRETGDVYLSIISGGNSICSVSSMIKKEVFDTLNGYDEQLVYEDLDLWIRASRNYEIDFVDAILIQKRVLNNSLGTNFFRKNNKINKSTYLILKKTLRLNRTKTEDIAVLKRVHFEIMLAFKNLDFRLLLKCIFLELKLRFRIIISKK